MLTFIDSFLNKTTMYRVVLYYLASLLGIAFVLSFFGVLPFTPLPLLLSIAVLVMVSWAVNTAFAFIFEAPTNIESTFITAFILALIITPASLSHFSSFLAFILWASIWAMASKFIFAIGNKHIFNPAAFAVALTAVTLNQSASWWIGNSWMALFVLLGGILLVRKLKRFDLAFSFFVVAFVTIIGFGIAMGGELVQLMQRMLFNSPLLFFSFVMITEPLTTPPTRLLRMLYGAFVGFLFAPGVHVGSLYSTPELALLVGNLYSYAVSPKKKHILKLEERVKVTPTIFDFVFNTDEQFEFKPGQYLEWTLGHYRPDDRGNRRYFTIASSPTEPGIRLGVKFYEPPSTFKKTLAFMRPGDELVASQLSGDFVLPTDIRKKLVFIAGGVGITPFRSMIKYLSDKDEKRDVILLYSNRTADEIAYKNVFDEAAQKIGLKALYAVTDAKANIPDWCHGGVIDGRMIAANIPDYKERVFYISGPRVMVDAFQSTLKGLGVKRKQIKIDFFPGFA